MSLWEYKHITSGPHGFATPALLESYLNQLGKDEWEIISFQSSPTNALAFNGVARRTTLRDWTLESAAAAAAKIEADKIRAEFAAKFQGNAPVADAAAEKPTSLVADTAAPEDGFRKLRDTTRDDDPDAPEEGDDWDNWENLDDDLPTLFEAIKPHLRKNQRGPGQSVGILFLSKRWEQTEADLVGALKECGFIVPESEDTPPEYLEFEGELYWLNLNNRHELFLNTREKPRPVFRAVAAKKLDPADPVNGILADEAAAEQAEKARRDAERLAREAEHAARRAEREAQRLAEIEKRKAQIPVAASAEKSDAPNPKSEIPPAPLPQGEDLLAAIRPQMRRNRRGPGYSGSTTYLSRAFKCTEADLVTALAAIGLKVPEAATDKPVPSTIGAHVYWLNKDSRGGIWINGDEAADPQAPASATVGDGKPAEAFPLEAAAESTPKLEADAPKPVPADSPVSPLAALRLLLKPNKRGTGVSAEIGALARTLEKDEVAFYADLIELGLALPATDDDKPAFVEHAGEVYWLNKNAKDMSVWLNAKTSKAAAKKAPPTGKPRAKKSAKKDE
ncbi:MAG TPA: hypothetical protein VL357_13185 [Rariglobus sp.]|jgi:hypothetical protein|nr:hypothetical protein [Rariglobus sp.]